MFEIFFFFFSGTQQCIFSGDISWILIYHHHHISSLFIMTINHSHSCLDPGPILIMFTHPMDHDNHSLWPFLCVLGGWGGGVVLFLLVETLSQAHLQIHYCSQNFFFFFSKLSCQPESSSSSLLTTRLTGC